MNYSDPTLADALAREYALGTLRGPARRRLERIAGENLVVRRSIHAWERRLAGLAQELTPVAPPASIWKDIELAIGASDAHAAAAPRRAGRWSGALAAMFALVAITIGALYLTQQPQTVTPDYIALLSAGEQQPAWSVQAFAGEQKLRIRSLTASTPPPGRVFELWMLPEDGSNPVSIGLIEGELTALVLDARQVAVLTGSSALAISEEPPGGSPTGVPTGDVLFVGALAGG